MEIKALFGKINPFKVLLYVENVRYNFLNKDIAYG